MPNANSLSLSPRFVNQLMNAKKLTRIVFWDMLSHPRNKDGDYRDGEGESFGKLQKEAFRTQGTGCALKRQYVLYSFISFSPIDRSKSKFRKSIDIKACQILQNKRYRNLDMSPIYFFCQDCVFE